MDRLKRLSPKHRHKPHVLLIERIPIWIVIILFIICSIAAAVFIGISFFTPPPHASQLIEFQGTGNTTLSDVFLKQKTAVFHARDLSLANQELTMNLILKPAADKAPFSVFKEDVMIALDLHGYNGDESKSEPIFTTQDIHTRVLFCQQGQDKCRGVFLAHLPFVGYKHYALGVKLLNADVLYKDQLIGDFMQVEFQYYSSEFAAWSIGWRYALLLLALPSIFGILAYQLVRQNISAWKTEQKVSVVLMVILILYDNPLYVFDYLVATWIFSLINYVFIVTFVCYLLYISLVLAHSIIRLPKDRSFMWFYLPKIMLTGTIWIVALIVLVYTRIQSAWDPAYMLQEDIQAATTVLFYFTLAAVLLYIVTMQYYFFRACGFCIARQLPRRYAPKFVAIALFVFILMGASLVDVLLFSILQANNGAQFLSFFVLYNIFSVFLSVLFLPTFTVDKKSTDSQQQQQQQSDGNDVRISMEGGDHLRPEDGGHVILEEEYFDDEDTLAEEYKPEEDHEWE